MNYLTEERRNALAAQYVLGTLQGPARVRFQRLLIQHLSMRQSVWLWEKYLNELGSSLHERAPDARVWQGIQARLGFDAAQPPRSNVVKLPAQRSQRPWQWLAVLSSAAALVLATLLLSPQIGKQEQLAPQQLAVMQSETAQPLWLIEMHEDSIRVRATDRLQAQADKAYELWMVAADGRPPVSLGLLPEQGVKTLPRVDLLDQVEIAALAVSLEPPGGSPTGQPTTVLYTAELVSL